MNTHPFPDMPNTLSICFFDFVFSHPQYNWNWSKLSKNPMVTIEIVFNIGYNSTQWQKNEEY